ncbi:MAG: 16S rRNA processing protein RimM [Blastocatellia bacterium]|nr:16S rRNA processing protein RimM [Blastocatellia bacterium]
MDELVAIARVARPHGLRGEVVADILTDFPDRFAGLENVIGLLDTGEHCELRIEGVRFQKDRMLIKFSGINQIESAEVLRNAEICIPETDAIGLEEGEFYDWELKDCLVKTLDGIVVGSVKELMRTGGTEILVVQGNSKDYLVPFAESICIDVDKVNKVIRIDPPEGLLDF